MPYGDPEPGDPNMLVGVVLPGGEDSMREMAYAFAEEFASLGYDEGRLMSLFRDPFYAGAHQAWRALGDPAIGEIVHESVELRGRYRIVVTDAPVGPDDAEEALEQLNPLVQIGGLRPADGGSGRDR